MRKLPRPLPRLSTLPAILALSLGLAGCDLVGDILEGAFWLGVLIVLVVVALIIWVVRKVGGRGRPGAPPPPPAP